ncbi:hypothetical protein BpHYR1_014794 [Brachionus plicatilis]|uniref:Uncharacterized protein n=1 Tax=Brachionus plicatilis TaxID=10195 RepID=A0A3M7SSS5_BRAPC|nr:hypothetical protein BpHYR1_014794 [Brachionus plicatilis]
MDKDNNIANISMEDEKSNQQELAFKYQGESLNNFKNPVKLQAEIDAYIGLENNGVKKAFINNKNRQLYIITDDPETIRHLKNYEWPKTSFISGIVKAIPKEQESILAVKGFDLSIDVEDKYFITNVLQKHNIIEARKIYKKSEKRPLPIIRIKTDTKSALSLLLNGLKVGYTLYRVEKWKSEKRPLQCCNCNKFNHHPKSTRNLVHSAQKITPWMSAHSKKTKKR